MTRRFLWAGLAAGLVLVLALGARGALAQLDAGTAEIPTAGVQRGRVDTSVSATGDVRAVRSQTLTAPATGAQVRILRLLPTGTVVKKGEVVVRFDPSDQEFQVEEQRSLLREAELEIEKLDAEGEAQRAQDEVDLLTARFDVRKGMLDVQGNELLGAIEARKRELTLEEARRRLAQLQEDVKSRAQSSDAALAVAREKQRKAQLTIDQAQRLLDQMELRAEMDGVVAVQDNRETNFFFTGMTFNEYREGDTVSSGRAVVDVLDLSQVELAVKVPETERARMTTGRTAAVRLDSIGGLELTARATLVGGIAPGRFWGQQQGPTRQFEVTFAFDSVPAQLRPGLTAQVTIAGEPLSDVLFVPRQAVIDREGKPHVYVKTGAGFTAREIKVVTRTPSVVVVDGVAEGMQVALTDPTRKPGAETAAPAGAPTRMVGTR